MDPLLTSHSDTSEDEDDQMPISPDRKPFSAALAAREIKIMDEDQIFKPMVAGQEEESFVLNDVVIFHEDLRNPRIANLLEIQFAEPSVLVVYGRLVLEPDEYKHGQHSSDL